MKIRQTQEWLVATSAASSVPGYLSWTAAIFFCPGVNRRERERERVIFGLELTVKCGTHIIGVMITRRKWDGGRLRAGGLGAACAGRTNCTSGTRFQRDAHERTNVQRISRRINSGLFLSTQWVSFANPISLLDNKWTNLILLLFYNKPLIRDQ